MVLLAFVPWKWPAANAALLLYLGAHVVTAPSLWRQRPWARKVAVVTALVGIAFGVIAVAGLLLSWAYLRSVYGSFGKGASLVALLIAATAFQLLSLYPALRLKALLAPQGGISQLWRKGIRGVLATFVLLPLVGTAGIHTRFALAAPSPLPRDVVAQALKGARQCLIQKPCAAPSGSGDAHEVYLSAFANGRLQARAHGQGVSLRAAAVQAASRLPDTNAAAQLKLDVVGPAAPVLAWPEALQAMAFDPGRDGLRVKGADANTVVLPDDVIAADVYGESPLLPFLNELRLGVPTPWLAQQLKHPAAGTVERFAVQGFIECEEPPAHVCSVERGVVQVPANTHAAAVAAGQFIVRAQAPDGTFAYVYRPWTNTTPAQGYNEARHAGTAYALAMLEPLAPGHGFLAGSQRALQWLLNHMEPACDGHLCLREGAVARVGPNALALLALVTYQRASGDTTWAKQAADLAAFLLHQQKSNGDLAAVFDVQAGRRVTKAPAQMFATEEAAMALASAARTLQDPTLQTAAVRALDFLTGEKYADFLGRFSYGIDSWTCMAAEALPDDVVKPRWVDFCLGYADFIGRLQFSPDERAGAFTGHYGFSHVLIPQAPAAAGFAEALTAVLALAKRHQRDVHALQTQVERALRALAQDQIRPGNDYLALTPAAAWGGIRRSVVESEVRIDFVQHAASALARGSALGI